MSTSSPSPVVAVPSVAAPARPPTVMVDYSHLLTRRRVGPWDQLGGDEILALLPRQPGWPSAEQLAGAQGKVLRARTAKVIKGIRRVLGWLAMHPGDGWQDRWISASGDDMAWIDTVSPDDPRSTRLKRDEVTAALSCLALHRVILVGYDFLARFKSGALLGRVRAHRRPDLFSRVEQAGMQRGLTGTHLVEPMVVISRMVLHTGKDIDELTPDDMLELFAWSLQNQGRAAFGLHNAWEILSVLGVTALGTTLRGALLHGQRSTADLVDDYQIRCRPIRDLLIRYLDERRPSLDHTTLRDVAGVLAGRFWADIEKHHPGIDALHLPGPVAQAWKDRIRRVAASDGNDRPRKDVLRMLTRVRAFYLDIQQWALEDPSWARWAVPCPVSKRDTKGFAKLRRSRQAEMHQRVRERLPHLPLLADTAERLHSEATAILAAAHACQPGDVFEYGQTRYQRKVPTGNRQPGEPSSVRVVNLTTNDVINLTRREDDAFWGWAIIETLRHTGVRIEELLEITHLALVSYRLPDTDELVPLLQIVPSKSNEERLLLISPELVSVLATIITRLRNSNNAADNAGTVPLVTRYDDHERLTGAPLPHLFQRMRGGRSQIISGPTARRLINQVLAATGLRDATGQPMIFTPHDFRRMFVTEAVSGGLPVHIAARLLGHQSLETTQAYLAVFQDELIRSYRSFLDNRRSRRPSEEYREPTDQEWAEFHQHFQLRKLELGTCGRPYGTPCKHEHACIRCPMLRVDPRQRHRLIEITRNLTARIAEARVNGWEGEAQGLQTSLKAANGKLASLDKTSARRESATHLGMPILRRPR